MLQCYGVRAMTLVDITVTKVIDTIRLLDSPVGVSTTCLNRKEWGVVLKIEGKTVYRSNGEEIISDGSHPVILPKGCNYTWQCMEAGLCLLVEFDALETAGQPYSFCVPDNSVIVAGFEKISKILANQNAAYQIDCKQQLYQIIRFLVDSVNKGYLSSDRKRRLQPAMDHISTQYFDCSITNDSLAALCGISTVHFRKSFESVYGMPPIRYLNRVRLNKARSLLCSDYGSIGQVAESVGFHSIYHFSKMFKLHTGVSPSEYAKASRK